LERNSEVVVHKNSASDIERASDALSYPWPTPRRADDKYMDAGTIIIRTIPSIRDKETT
jgi:hypothetical protein